MASPRLNRTAPVTIPVSLVHGMLAGVAARGEDATPFLVAAGIPAQLLDQPAARVTAAQYASLFRALIEGRADESLGLLARPLKPGSFALLARSALGARDLEEAIRRIAHTFWLLRDDLRLLLRTEGDCAGLALEFIDADAGAVAARQVFLHELLLRVFWRLAAWLAGGRLPARRFEFAFARPAHVDSYAQVFPAESVFESPQTAVWFDAAWLRAAMRRDATALRAFLAEAQANIIMPRRHDEVCGTRVRNHLRRTQPDWPDLAATASALNMSTATLQRRLAQEACSFQQLKDELRRDTAIVRLNTSTVTLAALAQELGFTDSAAFQRAFKAWTGSAPGAYRRGPPRF